jgi:hypothetical protein
MPPATQVGDCEFNRVTSSSVDDIGLWRYDYAAGFSSVQRPIASLAGSDDDEMIADQCEPAINAVRPDVPVTSQGR